MRPHESLFEGQNAAAASSGSDTHQDERAVIRFAVGDSVFVVDIEKVVRVTETFEVVRYPEPRAGHLGIVNLRGNVVPVLAFGKPGPAAADARLLVLEFAPGRRFCIQVTSPKKATFPADLEADVTRVVSLGGHPVRILGEDDFPAALEAEAPAAAEQKGA